MPKLTIDNLEIEVSDGTKVIDAAEQLGIMIPRFCYHPALGSAGACRVCAVKVQNGPLKGIRMACMVDAADGMVVSTTDADAVDFRRHVIEWLMANHPHDCPVCDEGGQCLLQDTTVAGGHGLRRYRGKKRTHKDQYLGPLIAHEMNRCIQCYRCVRFYREYAGYMDFGVMGIGSRVYFGRQREGTLESPFSGNLIDVCPTGVFTDKPSRFKGRRWDFQRAPSVCIHCSLGCRITPCARYREVVRHEARYHPDINGYFICDRGRYGYHYANASDRPVTALVEGRPVSWKTAVSELGTRLDRFDDPQQVVFVGSGRSRLETLGSLVRLCRARGYRGPVFQGRANPASWSDGSSYKQALASLKDVENADVIVAVAVDPVNEAPMLALAMRQAWRNGATIAVIDPRPVQLPFEFIHMATRLDEMAAMLPTIKDRNDALGRAIAGSQRPVVIGGPLLENGDISATMAGMIRDLVTDNPGCRFFDIVEQANSVAAAILDPGTDVFHKVLEDIRQGKIRALVAVETDPFRWGVAPDELREALKGLDLLVVMDYRSHPAMDMAHIIIPTTTLYETGGLMINHQGRVQKADPVYSGGIPLSRTGRNHPPREFQHEMANTQVTPANEVLDAVLATAMEASPLPDIYQWMADNFAVFAPLRDITQIPDTGLLLGVDGAGIELRKPEPIRDATTDQDVIQVLMVDWVFGTEELSCQSPALMAREPDPVAMMHPDSASQLGLQHGDRLVIKGNHGNLELPVQLAPNMAMDTVVIPRHHRLNWQVLGKGCFRIGSDQIQKLD